MLDRKKKYISYTDGNSTIICFPKDELYDNDIKYNCYKIDENSEENPEKYIELKPDFYLTGLDLSRLIKKKLTPTNHA